MWIGSIRYGIASFNGSVWENYNKDNVLESDNIRDIVVDKDNVKWIVYNDEDTGVTSFDGTIRKTYKQKDGLASNSIRTVKVDNNNVKWFITNNGGVSSFDGKNWKTYTESDGLHSNSIQTVEMDNNNVLWLRTSSGVSSFDGNTWTSKLGLDSQEDIAVDNNSVIWIGSMMSVSSFDGIIWHYYDKYFKEFNFSGFDFILSYIIIDKNNIKWFISYDIIISYDDKTDTSTGKTSNAITILGNYPNQFNSATSIQFDLYEWGAVDLIIYNIMGQNVRELTFGEMTAGRHSIAWDGTGRHGGKVSSGIYLYQVKTGKYIAGDRMMFVK